MSAPIDESLKMENNEQLKENISVDDEEEQKERDHFQRIVNAFKFYRFYSLKRVQKAEMYYSNIPEHHKVLIPDFVDHLNNVRTCIDHNYEIIKLIIQDTGMMFENKHHTSGDGLSKTLLSPTAFDMDKVKTTLKQFVRDWSESGKVERDACYDPIIKAILKRFPLQSCDPSDIQILVPGAGLGRLAFELAKIGYSCQGNEWSLFMLFASNFVLNKCKTVNSFTLYPWAHSWINNMSAANQIASIKFPDVSPTDMPDDANFSMAAGDFLEVYTEADSWDCLATVFFIDTAHNIIAYIEAIAKILKPGGYWVNLGPLLYHFSDMANESSIELGYEEVRKVILKFGFEFETEETHVKTTYTQDPKCMLQYEYNSVFFVARKATSDS